jgi:hypothetical protein
MKLQKVCDRGYSYETIRTDILRLKTRAHKPEPDEIIHFVHVDDFTRCYIFHMCYYLVIENCLECSEYMFPRWEKMVKRNGQSESKVAALFKETWSKMTQFAKLYLEDAPTFSDVGKDALHEFCVAQLDACLGSHCGKKRGVQHLGDSFLPPQVSSCGTVFT